jgi:hypothetical protein
MKRSAIALTSLALLALAVAAWAGADTVGPITFESPYAVGGINGQQGWRMSGKYDSAVAALASYPAAAGYGFGSQALRISSAVTSGALGDQTFAPPVTSAAGESTGNNHFEASFSIGAALSTFQPGLQLSVSPDDGNGARMSYLRFVDEPDGVHVFFDDVKDNGPVGTVAMFDETDIATLDRGHSHSIRFSMTFVPGPGNDVVKIYIDGALRMTGTSWENYYRYDPEQTPAGNVVPQTRTLIFREGPWALASGTANNGFLIDEVTMSSSNLTAPVSRTPCKKGGWKTFAGPSFKNQGRCIRAFNHQRHQEAGKGGSDDQGGGDNDNDQGDGGGHGHAHVHGNGHSHGHGNEKGQGEDT